MQKPNLTDLPTARQLWRSTALAAAVAGVILVTVVWPSEYGIDPTGVGGVLGLTEMGEIKMQLQEEAEADRQMKTEPQSSLGEHIFGLFVGMAHAQDAPIWKDEISFDLQPTEGIELKLVMAAGAVTSYQWSVAGGKVNYDMHGDAAGAEISYEKGRAVTEATGVLTAAFTGNHGWFWRNRGDAPVKITLLLAGDYTEVKR